MRWLQLRSAHRVTQPDTGVLGWVPGSGGQTLGVSIFSYADTVRIGFKVDATVVPEPDRLVAFFEEEIDALRDAAGTR